MIVVLLIVHGLLAVTLLGAITHQALAVSRRRAAGPAGRSFVDRFGAVGAPHYTVAIMVLLLLTTLLGVVLYPQYRIDVRPTLEDLALPMANGAFEIKEHLAAIAVGLLPAYWSAWRGPVEQRSVAAQRGLTWILAGLVWYGFIVGHVLNNIRGMVPL